MQHSSLDFSKIPQLSDRDRAYTTGNPKLAPFYKYPVDLDSFQAVIKDKQMDQTNRKVLVEALNEQYKPIGRTPKVEENINLLLKENAFTVTTAHQPSLATGPLYFIYKIISTINLAEQLAARYPEQHFIPIYIQGSEDHDFDEINHFNLFGKRLTWEATAGGSVGKMSTEGIAPVLEELKEILGESDRAGIVFDLMHRAYAGHATLDEAIFYLVNELFARFGLVVVIGSVAKLKQLFIPVMKKEILEQPSEKLVNQTIKNLEEIGFKGQATPRNINFFYLGDGFRNRIVFEDETYKVLGSKIEFTRNEMKNEIEKNSEKFSPNVIMRPLYQETILPNLAYIGGGGELAYWLERKKQFEFFNLNFPMLVRRDSVLWVDAGSAKKIAKLGLTIEDLFQEEEALVKRFVKENTEAEVSLKAERKTIAEIFEQIKGKATAINPGLKKTVLADAAKIEKSLQQLEGKLLREEKRNFETSTNQIRSLKSKLFPSGLQERHDNFIAFYLKHGDGFIDTLKEHLDPMRKEFNVFY